MDKTILERLLCEKVYFISKQLYILGVDDRDIDSLTLDVLEQAHKSLKKLRDVDKIESWLKTIIVRRSSKYFGKKSGIIEISNMFKNEYGEEVNLYDLCAVEKSAEEILIEAERNEDIRRLVASLPPAKKRIIQMRIFGEYKFSEIAEVMKVKENTVKTIFYRTMDELRKEAQNER